MDWRDLKKMAVDSGFIDNGVEVEKTDDKSSVVFTNDGKFYFSIFKIGRFSGFWRNRSLKEKIKDFVFSIKNYFLNKKYNKRVKKWLKR